MSAEGVAFAVVLALVGAVPGLAALVAYRQTAKRTDARLVEILALLRRGPAARRTIGYEIPPRDDAPKAAGAS